jgi:hypothetical protein
MFIITPRGGLCNQLTSIIKGILLGIKYNRNVYIDGFQIDYNKKELCKIEMILNIDKINNFLMENGINNFKIITTLDEHIINENANAKSIFDGEIYLKYKIADLDYVKVSSLININDYIEKNLDKEILCIGNVVSLQIYESFGYAWNDVNNLYHLLSRNIVFNDVFYKLKTIIKTNLNLTEYVCIHLRIEDDCINYCATTLYNIDVEEYNNKLLLYYDNEIKNISIPIYICSGIHNPNNKINFDYYQNLKNNNNLIYDKQNIYIDEYYSSNRELIAIVDYLIALDGYQFIGNEFSSFSILIHNNYKFNNKDTKIFNINH